MMLVSSIILAFAASIAAARADPSPAPGITSPWCQIAKRDKTARLAAGADSDLSRCCLDDDADACIRLSQAKPPGAAPSACTQTVTFTESACGGDLCPAPEATVFSAYRCKRGCTITSTTVKAPAGEFGICQCPDTVTAAKCATRRGWAQALPII